MTRPHLEFLAEINNESFTQNQEWLSSDLQVHHRPKECIMSVGINANKTIQITLDSGSTWVDFATAKKLDFKDQINLVISPDDLVNFRCTDSAGS